MSADITKTINSSGNCNVFPEEEQAYLLKAHRVSSRFSPSRAFTTSPTRQIELPEPNTTIRSSIPLVTSERAKGAAKLTSPTPASSKVAAEIKKVAGRATET